MHTIDEQALEAMEALTNLEQKCCLDIASRLKNLGMHKHASSAICALADGACVPVKH